MSKNAWITIVVIIVIVIIGWAVYASMQNSPMDETGMQATTTTDTSVTGTDTTGTGAQNTQGQGGVNTVTTTTVTSSTTSATLTGNTDTINVTGRNYNFSPSQITVKKGDKVTIIFTSAGGPHDFAIDAFGVKTKTVNNGESDTVSFIADKTGTFEFYCSVANHRQMGMVGSLIVK